MPRLYKTPYMTRWRGLVVAVAQLNLLINNDKNTG